MKKITLLMRKTQNIMMLLAILLLGSCVSQTKEDSLGQPKKIADYLWEVTLDNYCDTVPNSMVRMADVDFACSAVRNGNFYGRNLDFFITECSEFVVHVPAKEGRHASVGVAKLDQSTDADIEKGYPEEKLYLLPWGTYDGINDAGLFCNMNVVPYADGGENPGTNPGKPDVMNTMLVRALLDNCASVDEAIEYINSHNIIGHNLAGFNLHFMIGDPEKNVVLEIINNQAVIKEQYIMTNFFINIPDLTPGADGVERYNILKDHYAEGGESMEGMWNLMKRVRYSQSYDPETKPFWKSEFFAGGKYNMDTPVDTFLADPEVKAGIEAFKKFKETGEYDPEDRLWFTTHNSIYDIKEKKLWVTVREKYEKRYEFSL